jgi:hypothetical protein
LGRTIDVLLSPLATVLEEEAVNAIFSWVGPNLKRLAGLIRREGLLPAWKKGVRYLRWRIPSEVVRLRMLRLASIEDRFTLIYRTNMWAAKESRSGPAASLEGTEKLRRELPALFARLGVKTLFDAPCGDFYWMQRVVQDYPLTYIGGDIVRPMIESNEARFGGPARRFVHVDVTRDEVPRADLWLCRGLHSLLSLEDGLKALRQFVRSGTPYILLSSHRNPERSPNVDIASGDYREIDMFAPPFNLPPPILCLEDRWDEDLCLWSREQVEEAIGCFRTPRAARDA